jgi:hypothetical protein
MASGNRFTRRKYPERRSGVKGTRERLGLTKQCPPGYILRAPYRRGFKSMTKKSGYNVHKGNRTIRVYPKARSTIVKATCIKDRGLSGKGPRSGKGIGSLKKGELSRYGYSAHGSTEERHKAIEKAIKVYGALSVFHKLDAIAKYTQRTAPEAHRIFKADRHWVQSHYSLRKNA